VLGTQDPFDCCTEAVAVLLGNGDGTFQAAVPNYGGLNPACVAIGDFNLDGKPDLVAGFATNYSVHLGNGDGTFQGAVIHSAAKWTPVSLATGDINGDGNLDLVAACSGWYDPSTETYTNGSVLVVLGNGNGTFQAPGSYSTGRTPYSVAVDDLNGDGWPDLAVANLGDGPAFTNGSVSVLLGNGDGTLRRAVNYVTGPGPSSVAVGDFNGDGKLDIVVANYGSGPAFTNGSISVLLGNGHGAFRVAINTSIVPSPVSIAVADFNGDGSLDVAVSHDSYGTGAPAAASVMLGNGDGTFQSAASFGVGVFLRDSDRTLAVGDFNGDGKPNLAVASCNGVTVFPNTCPSAGVRLAVTRADDGFTLSWPLPYTNFVLESTTSFTPTNWQSVIEAMTTNNGRCETTVPLDQEQSYFRLRKP